MSEDDYELLSHEEIEKLRSEIEHLKKNPFPSSKQNKNLLDSMEELNNSIKKLVGIFEGTQDGLIKEYEDSSPTKMLKEISEENKKIAEGILSVAKMIKDEINKSNPEPRSMPKPPKIKNNFPPLTDDDLPPIK